MSADLDQLRRDLVDRHKQAREAWALWCVAIEAERKAAEAYAAAMTELLKQEPKP